MGLNLGGISNFANTLVKRVENKAFDLVHELEGHKPAPAPTTVLASKQVSASGNAPVMLRFRASAPAAHFSKSGREVAPLDVYVDGKYFSTEVAFAEKGQNASYAVNLGALKAGAHTVELKPARNGGPQPVVSASSIVTEEASGLRAQLQRYAPLLVTRAATGEDERPTMFHTDVPLQLRADVTGDANGLHVLTYHVSFTDEDGGTSPADRLKIYGRTIDDEWCYRVLLDGNGNKVDPKSVKNPPPFVASLLSGESFQYGNDDLFATRHQPRVFDGLRVGDRPVIQVNSDNNNFDQLKAGSKLPRGPLWSPVVVLTPKEDGRQVVKDNPLFERLSLEELRREDRAEGLPVDWP